MGSDAVQSSVSEISVNFYRTTWRHVAEVSYHYGSLRSNKILISSGPRCELKVASFTLRSSCSRRKGSARNWKLGADSRSAGESNPDLQSVLLGISQRNVYLITTHHAIHMYTGYGSKSSVVYTSGLSVDGLTQLTSYSDRYIAGGEAPGDTVVA
jgi:hypothetical protein